MTTRKLFMLAAWAIAAAAMSVTSVSAQRTVTLAESDIPHLPVDTLSTDRKDVRIVTFSDGTFRFIPANPFHFRAAEAYGAHWDTINLFAYRTVELADLPPVTMLEVCDSLATAFRSPAVGQVISKYGVRGRRNHNGTDIKVEQGEPIYAAFDGIVRLSRWNSGGFGNVIIIRHPSGLETYYAHLSRRAVAADEWVRAGQVIGYGGKTGRAFGTHLHFETRYRDHNFDPEHLIDFETGRLLYYSFALRKEMFSITSRAVEGIESDPDEMPLAADSLAAAKEQQKAEEPVYYTVKSGDTLLAIARNHGTTTTEICRLNGITRNGILRIGKRLRIK